MVNSMYLSWCLVCILAMGSITTASEIENKCELELEAELYTVLQSIEETLNYSSQIEILDLEYKGNKLSIDLSDELIQYGGGTSAEYYVGEMLLSWGFEATDAEFISLLIEGQAHAFPEGSAYDLYWKEDYQKNIKYKVNEELLNEENNICNTE